MIKFFKSSEEQPEPLLDDDSKTIEALASYEKYVFDKRRFDVSKPGIMWGIYSPIKFIDKSDMWIKTVNDKIFVCSAYVYYVAVFELNRKDVIKQVGWFKKKEVLDYESVKRIVYSTRNKRNPSISNEEGCRMTVMKLSELINMNCSLTGGLKSSLRQELNDAGFWNVVNKQFMLQDNCSFIDILKLLETSNPQDPLYADLQLKYSQSLEDFNNSLEELLEARLAFKKVYRNNQHLKALSAN